MDKDKFMNIAGISAAALMLAGMVALRFTYEPSNIAKETLAVASAKCAYNGTTLHDITQHRFNGLGNLKSIVGPAPFSDSYSVTCDNGAIFKFEAKWKDPLTETVKTSTITAPEKK